MTALDSRMRTAGLGVTVATLAAVLIDHRPVGTTHCVRCRHRYTTAAPHCPSYVLARTLLRRRHAEDRQAAAPILDDIKARDDRVLPAPHHRAEPVDVELFDTATLRSPRSRT